VTIWYDVHKHQINTQISAHLEKKWNWINLRILLSPECNSDKWPISHNSTRNFFLKMEQYITEHLAVHRLVLCIIWWHFITTAETYRCVVGLLGGSPVEDVGGSNCCELLFTYGVRGCTGNAGVCGRGLIDCGGLPVSSLIDVVRHDEKLSSLNWSYKKILLFQKQHL
jgi:hypothetical protein